VEVLGHFDFLEQINWPTPIFIKEVMDKQK